MYLEGSSGMGRSSFQWDNGKGGPDGFEARPSVKSKVQTGVKGSALVGFGAKPQGLDLDLLGGPKRFR